jgi:hypothetical protein
MKALILAATLSVSAYQLVFAFDTEKASSPRYKVAYVEPEKTPSLSVLPAYCPNREWALRDEASAIQKGIKTEEIELIRKKYLRHALYPIRVTDLTTGAIYEVQSDRRTITAKTAKGEILWTVNPFVDEKMEAYRVPHPVIVYFGTSPNRANRKGEFLSIAFDSSQFGDLDLETGKFYFAGQD